MSSCLCCGVTLRRGGNSYPRKILNFSTSSAIPRLPPILQKDIQRSPPTHPRRKKTDRIQSEFSFDSKQSKTTLLPKLERSHFEANTVYYKVNKSLPSETTPVLEKAELKTSEDILGKFQKQETISKTILGIRRKKRDRLSRYRCAPTTVIDDEIAQLEQTVGFDAISQPNSTNVVKDMKGRMILSGDSYNEGVSSLITVLDEDEKFKKNSEKELENESPKNSGAETSVRQRFLKALDAHFFNEFVNAKTGRRMAICDELEKDIIGDGKTSLTGLREHLRLQDVLDSWVL
ncbi:hypothetical protein AC249_AIPGENE3763 [Exaiptasia diaphana]|nr:hypothetical protein AC249_AIPGENE3763 [Exaiptasia diaphana]